MNKFRGLFIFAIGMIHVLNGADLEPLLYFPFGGDQKVKISTQGDVLAVLNKYLHGYDPLLLETLSWVVADKEFSKNEIYKILANHSGVWNRGIISCHFNNAAEALIVDGAEKSSNLKLHTMCGFNKN